MARVVFFGSPDFAVPSLISLGSSRFRPILVVTQPDRPAGRGRRLMPTPVRRAADEAGMAVRVVGSFRDGETRDFVASLDADFFVVVAFGLIFPPELLRVSRKGNINVHASLLPAYRGASPVNAALVGGESFTGVTTMEMAESLDTGPIYLQRIVPIDPGENAGELSSRLAPAGASLLVETLEGLDGGRLAAVAQDELGASTAPRLAKQDGLVPWESDAIAVHNHIRGMNPWPGSYTRYGERYLKIHRAAPCDLVRRDAPAGTILDTDGDAVTVACGRGAVLLKKLQCEGRRPLDAREFVRGFPLERGAVLGHAGMSDRGGGAR